MQIFGQLVNFSKNPNITNFGHMNTPKAHLLVCICSNFVFFGLGGGYNRIVTIIL